MNNIEHIFIHGVLPELIGKWYTRKPVADSDGVVPGPSTSSTSAVVEDKEDYEKLWCFCNQPSFGTMSAAIMANALLSGFIVNA